MIPRILLHDFKNSSFMISKRIFSFLISWFFSEIHDSTLLKFELNTNFPLFGEKSLKKNGNKVFMESTV